MGLYSWGKGRFLLKFHGIQKVKGNFIDIRHNLRQTELPNFKETKTSNSNHRLKSVIDMTI